MKKRRTSIKKSLLNNSKAAIISAIEIHNKPLFSYRYEVCTLLVINAWELLLKAYIYKNLKKVKLFKKDGTTKPFDECLDCVASELGKPFAPMYQSISLLYKYRNEIAHLYSDDIDIIIFSLLKPNISFYCKFIKQQFDIDLFKETNLVLLPIGFAKPYSPIDFISNTSLVSESPKEIKYFVSEILKSTKELFERGIEEPIVVDFRISLINEKRVKNADIIAGINNQTSNIPIFSVSSKAQTIQLTTDPNATAVRLTHEKEGTQGTLIHEELSDNIFNEINNVIEANMILSRNKDTFVLGENVYYRIYAEREHVTNDLNTYYFLAKSALYEIYAPCLFWITKLHPEKIAQLIFGFLKNIHSPQIRGLIKLTTLLNNNINEWLFECLSNVWEKHPQPPDYYWSLKKIIDNVKNEKNICLLAIKQSTSTKLLIPETSKSISIKEFINNIKLANEYLNKTCLLRFEGFKEYRSTTRILDVLCYGEQLNSLGSKVENEMKRSIYWHKMKTTKDFTFNQIEAKS